MFGRDTGEDELAVGGTVVAARPEQEQGVCRHRGLQVVGRS